MPDCSAVPGWKKVEALENCISMLSADGVDVESIKAKLHSCRADQKTGKKSISFGIFDRGTTLLDAEQIQNSQLCTSKDDIVVRTTSGEYTLPNTSATNPVVRSQTLEQGPPSSFLREQGIVAEPSRC